MKYLKEEEYIYRDCSIRMSVKAMSNLLYATIITRSSIPTSYGVGIYEYDRKQNAYNNVEVKIHIHPDMIEKFEEESGIKLRKPQSITIN